MSEVMPLEQADEQIPETKGERTRRRLLEIAIERFGERGYRATSVSEIARAAGLTQAAVYAYFDSKEALFDAAVDADAADAIAETAAKVGETPVSQLVPMIIIMFLAHVEERPLVKRVLGNQEPEALKRLVDLPALDQILQLITERVRAAQAAGEVRSDLDPEMFAGGAEAIILCLLMSVVQIGQTTMPRRQMGVISVFESALQPPRNGSTPS